MSYLFAFSCYSWVSRTKNTGVVCHSLLQWTIFCQNSPLWPICLGWPCMAWLRASLSYASSFARLWSLKGPSVYVHVQISFLCFIHDLAKEGHTYWQDVQSGQNTNEICCVWFWSAVTCTVSCDTEGPKSSCSTHRPKHQETKSWMDLQQKLDFLKYLLIYLTVLRLSWSTWDLQSSFGMRDHF